MHFSHYRQEMGVNVRGEVLSRRTNNIGRRYHSVLFSATSTTRYCQWKVSEYTKYDHKNEHYRLPCSLAVHSLLGSYMVQIVHGDWNADVASDPQSLSQLYANFKFAPKHSTELLTRIYQLHQGHK
jgi:hypothetical protein